MMPLPILWLGAAAISAATLSHLSQDRKQQQRNRNTTRALKFSEQREESSGVNIYPSQWFNTEQETVPKVGAIVCCTLKGVLEHTGIWVGDNTIVELSGSGLVKAVSPERFVESKADSQIFVATDSLGYALASENAAERAVSQIYQYQEYDFISNNCHYFVWRCFNASAEPLTTFKRLNYSLASYFDRVIYWDKCLC